MILLAAMFDYTTKALISIIVGIISYIFIIDVLNFTKSEVTILPVLVGFGCFAYLLNSSFVANIRILIFESFLTGFNILKTYKKNYNLIKINNEAELYRLAENEFDSGLKDKALLSLAFSKANGDKNKQKSEYMKLRVQQLKNK